jgi:aromatic ring-cleaving dioxygenase
MLEHTAEITSFHAHIYYDITTREMAEPVRQGLGIALRCSWDAGTIDRSALIQSQCIRLLLP